MERQTSPQNNPPFVHFGNASIHEKRPANTMWYIPASGCLVEKDTVSSTNYNSNRTNTTMTIAHRHLSTSFRRSHSKNNIVQPLSSPPMQTARLFRATSFADNDDTDGSDHTCIQTSQYSKLGQTSLSPDNVRGIKMLLQEEVPQQLRSPLSRIAEKQQRDNRPTTLMTRDQRKPSSSPLDDNMPNNHTNMTNAKQPERKCYSPCKTSRSWVDRHLGMVNSKDSVTRGCVPTSMSTTTLNSQKRASHCLSTTSSSSRYLGKGNTVDISHTKLYRTRINTAATNIQRIFRGILARNRTVDLLRDKYISDAAIQIQTRVRRMLAKQVVHKIKAVLPIQALFRGYRYRKTSQIPRLEMRLERIEQRKKRELFEIQMWKKREMKYIRERCYEQIAKTKAERKENKKVFRETEMIATKYFAENRKLEEENEKLQIEMDVLARENELLLKQSTNQKLRTHELTDIMDRVKEESEVLITVASKLKSKIRNVKRQIQKHDELVVMEKRLSNKYFITLQTMGLTLGDQCDDEKLVMQVESMCLRCEQWRGQAASYKISS